MGSCYSVRKALSFSLPLSLSSASASASASQPGAGAGVGLSRDSDRDGDADALRLRLRLSSSSSGRASSSSFPLILHARTQDDILLSSTLHSFSFSHLKAATRNFRPDSVLGQGGFGSVFKGWVHDTTLAPAKPGLGIAVAIKRLNHHALQGHSEWLAEVHYLGRLSHPNLVRLLGYCSEDEQRLLVYEFMPRGSLDNHLFRRASYFQPLSWQLRMKVALGAARGLAFLHSAQAKVIYRDFKTSNVLLDSNYNAKLSDFGLAKDGPTGENSHVSTRVMGTHGYAAPEYLATGHLTTKSDVYSFGVVLLEILSGRRAIDKNRPQGEDNLVEWARPYLRHKRKIFRILDRRLEAQCSPEGAHTVASLASQCLMADSKLRPRMKDVVSVLEQLQVQVTDEKEQQKLESIENKEGPKHKVDADKLTVKREKPKVPVCL